MRAQSWEIPKLFSDEIPDSSPLPECPSHLSHHISYLRSLVHSVSATPGLQTDEALSYPRTLAFTGGPFSEQPSEPLSLKFSPVLSSSQLLIFSFVPLIVT